MKGLRSTGVYDGGIVRGAPIVVLLVDDQAFIATAIRQLLASEPDIDLHHCSSAVDAVAMANRIRPAVILQDLVMPDGDGLMLVEAFRRNPETAHTSVVVLSGNDDSEMRRRALNGGASDYLVKLPAREQIVSCIRRHAARTDDQSLDRATLDAFRHADPAGAPAFITTLIDQFLEEAASLVAGLSEASRQLDAGSLQALAHSLKGSANTMGAAKLAALCAQMEHHAASRRGGVIQVLMKEIEQELARVQDALISERGRAN